jgi:hypothetical protein
MVLRPGKAEAVTNLPRRVHSENEMQFSLAMSATTSFPQQSSFRRTHETNLRVNARESQIAMRATLKADKRRIFDALTLPEYMETWLCLPCSHSSCRTTASQTGSRFRFDHFVADALDLSITGCYQVCRRGKMSFTWQKSIRLYGEFACSTLCLTHSGFLSPDEHRWHSDMWQLSLTKLQALF